MKFCQICLGGNNIGILIPLSAIRSFKFSSAEALSISDEVLSAVILTALSSFLLLLRLETVSGLEEFVNEWRRLICSSTAEVKTMAGSFGRQ